MKVLYVLAHFPQGSESYVEAEIAYMKSQGVQIEVWSPTSGYGDAPTVQVHRRSLAEALIGFAPDVVHIHHLTTAVYYLDNFFKVPVTVRAHSFDWDPGLVKLVAAHPSVRRVFAFPHLAATVPSQKMVPMPVAYDQTLYYRTEKNPRSVVRLSAGLPTKRLEDFLDVGNEMHEQADFTLAINLVVGKESRVAEDLSRTNAALGGHVQILHNLSRARAAELTRNAAIYMSTYDDKSHQFGMPISIAEAMATGAVVVVRDDVPGVHEYMGLAGLFYVSTAGAKDLIRVALAISEKEREVLADVSCRNAVQFRSDVVLPRLLKEWEWIVSPKF